MEKPGAVFVFEELDFFCYLVHLFGTKTFNISLKMVTECAPPIITPTRREIGQDEMRHKIFFQRQSVKIRRRQFSQIFGADFLVDVNAGLVLVDEVGQFREIATAFYRFGQLQVSRFTFINYGAVKPLPQSFYFRQGIADAGDDVPAQGDMRCGKLFLDHFAEGEGGDELFLLHHRNADHRRAFALHHRANQHPVNVAIDIYLVVINRFQDFRGHERFINDIGLDGRETDLRRIISQRDQRHGFVQAVCCPFQLVNIVEGV